MDSLFNKSVLSSIFISLLSLGCFGCGNSDSGGGNTSEDTDTRTDAEIDTDTDTDDCVVVEFKKGPYLQHPSKTDVIVMWETESPSRSIVRYGSDEKYGLVKSTNEEVTIHEVRVSGLAEGIQYHYSVRSGDECSADSTMRTAVSESTPFTFAVFGDNQYGTAIFEEIVEQMKNTNPDFFVGVGDLTQNGTYEQFQEQLFAPAKPLMKKTPFYAVLGNHDSDSPWFYNLFSNPNPENYYSFIYGKAFFVVLDTNKQYTSGTVQYNWLEDELASSEAQNADWLFVFFHHPPWTNYWDSPGYDGDYDARQYLVPLFSQYDVDLVFNGHAHNYQRGEYEDVHYIITGGGGGAIDTVLTGTWSHMAVAFPEHHFCHVALSHNSLVLRAIDLEGNDIEEFVINK